ncbi:Serine dehydrogenase proteinase [compost metagenome]
MDGRICIVLATPGGVVEAVEKMVEVTRHHFSEVFFVVPTAAMSAGTIFCMSGDKIFMDYTSSLGPIDPQVPLSDGQLVPALGYIDKVNELIEKSAQGKLTDAEFMMLQRLDLATLRRYEQARDLSVSLLKQWLVKYKFKDWTAHRTNNPGQPVTLQEKEARAEQIAKDLSDNNRWHSHGRMIGINTLTTGLKLEIEDYSQDDQLRQNLRIYSELLAEHTERQQAVFMLHYT